MLQLITFLVFTFAFAISSASCGAGSAVVEDVYFRINQVGYPVSAVKVGTIFLKSPIKAAEFHVCDAATRKSVFSGPIGNSLGAWGGFQYHYRVDFSALKAKGRYYIEAGGKRSFTFSIDDGVYSGVVDSLMEFFKVQRCGPTNPKMHGVCHKWDSPQVANDASVQGVDVTGGWHDAGDYIKFLNTSAYTTYMLLLSYELNKPASEFDNDKNGVPDLLEEARVGIDWLMRCNYAGSKLITQVQDNRDHDVGWRLPENDTLRYARPAFAGKGKSVIGLYSAALALAAKIWKERFHEDVLAESYLSTAEKIYATYKDAPDVDVTNTGMYSDKNYLGKLSLGAVELYNSTRKSSYLLDAKTYSQRAGADYWWSWGDMNSLAHFRISQYQSENLSFIEKNLIHFNTARLQNIYGEAAAYTWGTTNTLLGCALQAAFFQRLSGSNQYDSLIQAQLDYVFGHNPWGLSFFYGFGSDFVRNFHSQIAFFTKGRLPGGISAGPAPSETLKGLNIQRKDTRTAIFNSKEVEFYDDRMDHICNEPTIVTNATAVFLFLHLKNRRQ